MKIFSFVANFVVFLSIIYGFKKFQASSDLFKSVFLQRGVGSFSFLLLFFFCVFFVFFSLKSFLVPVHKRRKN